MKQKKLMRYNRGAEFSFKKKPIKPSTGCGTVYYEISSVAISLGHSRPAIIYYIKIAHKHTRARANKNNNESD